VTFLKAKEKARIKSLEKKRRKRFFSSNIDSKDDTIENGKENNEKKNDIQFDKKLVDKNCEKFSLILSVPFQHAQHVRGGLPGDTRLNSEKPYGRDGVTDVEEGNDYNNNNNNDNNNNTGIALSSSGDKTTLPLPLSLETSASNSILAFSAALTPCTDGWTLLGGQGDGDGGKNPTPFGPIRPLFYPQQREEDVSHTSSLILKTTQIPCSGPGYPISSHSSGDFFILFFTDYFFTFLFTSIFLP
jgi:hypothetical protein